MRDLRVPVKQLKAEHTGAGAQEASFEDGGNLHKNMPLCIGARVMLLENLWTERGLVNGALGTVRDFTWAEGSNTSTDLPVAIMVEFDHYEGPGVFNQDDDATRPVIPITPSKRQYQIGNTACTRTQFPLTVAYAITVHKAQGITKDRIVCNIATKDHVVGLTYVAVSRVKHLKGIMFEEPFDYSRFRAGKESKTETMRLADVARRLPQHIPVPIPSLD